jgi:predicted nucleic acid-binding Zn ribbon protein
MAFNSLNHLLDDLETRCQPQEQKQLRLVIRCWSEIVGTIVSAQAQPIAIQRGVLKVATSSSAWAQNLVFERQRLLEKLNQRLLLSLTDIRFSTVQWQQSPSTSYPGEDYQTQLWQKHPSRLRASSPPSSSSSTPEVSDPVLAFKQWAQVVRSQSHHLPICPHCHCPTPEGELERWKTCAHCAAKQW